MLLIVLRVREYRVSPNFRYNLNFSEGPQNLILLGNTFQECTQKVTYQILLGNFFEYNLEMYSLSFNLVHFEYLSLDQNWPTE